jgi:hypothetical protein
LFDRYVAVDWSAASAPGPARPAADRCWIGVRDAATGGVQAIYCRTRRDAEGALAGLLHGGRVLVGFDFPFGAPAGSGLGGGRPLAARLAGLIEDGADGRNNRFVVAAGLNATLNPGGAGPFWGHPRGLSLAGLPAKARKRVGRAIADYRVTDRALRPSGIQSFWRLYGTGSVGGQALLGLPAVHRLASAVGARLWPFETAWDAELAAVTIAEIWPSLFPLAGEPGDIKDARQVLGACRAMAEADHPGALRQWLARPAGLSPAVLEACESEEGWILGAPGSPSLLSPPLAGGGRGRGNVHPPRVDR